jgi:type IV pilus assembly protein PilW
MKSYTLRSKMTGLSLIELMIASLLGIVVTIFITQVMVTTGSSNRLSEGLAQTNENGRFITSWVQDRLRKSGYAHDIFVKRITPFADTCAAATPVPPANNANCSLNTNIDSSDRIAIRRQFSDRTQEDQRTCSGELITGLANEDVVVDVIWQESNFGVAGDNYNDVLRCATYIEDTGAVFGTTQVIANGVEGLQILYGIATSAEDPSDVREYVNADGVADWNLVRSVRLAVLSRSFSDTSLDDAERSYVLLDANAITNTDRIARSVQTLTVHIPNE